MTIEELLDMSAAQLAAMTDVELLEHFKPYFEVVRPEFRPPPKMPTHKATAIANTKQFAAKVGQLKDMGIDIDLSFLQKRKK